MSLPLTEDQLYLATLNSTEGLSRELRQLRNEAVVAVRLRLNPKLTHKDKLSIVKDELKRLFPLNGKRILAQRPLGEAIGRLTGLTSLWLVDNHLTAMPESLGCLTDLTKLDLLGNRLTGLPESLGRLTVLNLLDLGDSELASLPESIGQLTSLTKLYLDWNQLTSLPESIGQLTGLTKLILNGNQLTALPESIGQLTGLTELDLQKNRLTALPESIGQLTGLTKLDLQKNRLTGLPESFEQLTGLNLLDLRMFVPSSMNRYPFIRYDSNGEVLKFLRQYFPKRVNHYVGIEANEDWDCQSSQLSTEWLEAVTGIVKPNASRETSPFRMADDQVTVEDEEYAYLIAKSKKTFRDRLEAKAEIEDENCRRDIRYKSGILLHIHDILAPHTLNLRAMGKTRQVFGITYHRYLTRLVAIMDFILKIIADNKQLEKTSSKCKKVLQLIETYVNNNFGSGEKINLMKMTYGEDGLLYGILQEIFDRDYEFMRSELLADSNDDRLLLLNKAFFLLLTYYLGLTYEGVHWVALSLEHLFEPKAVNDLYPEDDKVQYRIDSDYVNGDIKFIDYVKPRILKFSNYFNIHDGVDGGDKYAFKDFVCFHVELIGDKYFMPKRCIRMKNKTNDFGNIYKRTLEKLNKIVWKIKDVQTEISTREDTQSIVETESQGYLSQTESFLTGSKNTGNTRQELCDQLMASLRDGELMCIICGADLLDGQELGVLPCGHLAHYNELEEYAGDSMIEGGPRGPPERTRSSRECPDCDEPFRMAGRSL